MRGRCIKVVSKETQDGPPTVRGQPVPLACDNCDEPCELAIELASHSDDEYGPCHYCFVCIREAWGLV